MDSFLSIHGMGSGFFWYGLVVVGFQFAFLILLLLSVMYQQMSANGDVDNPAKDYHWIDIFIPANANRTASGAQIIALLYYSFRLNCLLKRRSG